MEAKMEEEEEQKQEGSPNERRFVGRNIVLFRCRLPSIASLTARLLLLPLHFMQVLACLARFE